MKTGIISVFLLLCFAAAAQLPVHTLVNDSTEVWKIDKPQVNILFRNYRNVLFKPGDEIKIEAGGCVNVSEENDHWVNYVTPEGENADRYYYGTISIPGITAGMVPLAGLVNKPLSIGKMPWYVLPNQMYLKTGYLDNYYDDNGYAHFNTAGTACQQQGPAWMKITMVHHVPETARQRQPDTAKMDLVWKHVDDNGLPRNPIWAGYRENFTLNAQCLCGKFYDVGSRLSLGCIPCSNQKPLVDQPLINSNFLHFCICHFVPPATSVRGHINWGEVTYHSQVYFEDWQGELGQDDDIDMDIEAPGAITTGNKFPYDKEKKPGLTIEFNFSETIKHFNTPWWNDFRNKITQTPHKNYAAARSFVGRKDCYVIGLMGIDNQHGGGAEIHPVHALFIKIAQDDNTERWAFFARNWGSEGFCSAEQHFLAETEIKVYFSGAESINVANSIILANTNKARYTDSKSGDGLLLTLYMPNYKALPLIHGEIEFKRTKARVADTLLAFTASDTLKKGLLRTRPLNLASREAEEKRIQLPGVGPVKRREILTALRDTSLATDPLDAAGLDKLYPAVYIGAPPNNARGFDMVAFEESDTTNRLAIYNNLETTKEAIQNKNISQVADTARLVKSLKNHTPYLLTPSPNKKIKP